HLDQCHLQPEPSNAIRKSVYEFAIKHDIAFYNLKNHEGQLRNLIIRTANTGQIMVVLQFAKELNEKITGLLHHISTNFPEITSLNYINNNKKNETYGDQEAINFAGQPFIEEQMEGL